ncbi:hypothetical protein L195_g051082, partial [Trifolium pratense]
RTEISEKQRIYDGRTADGFLGGVHHVRREVNQVVDALPEWGCVVDEFRVLDKPSFDVEQLCSYDALGVFTPCIISV